LEPGKEDLDRFSGFWKWSKLERRICGKLQQLANRSQGLLSTTQAIN
jgi:hypothetical protein